MNGTATRSILVIARRDPLEAMRVAAGITVFGHQVELVFAHGRLEIVPETEQFAELIELAEISPKSLHEDPEVPGISNDDFHQLVEDAEFVINV